MRNLLLAAAATLVVATPAMARDGSAYIGIEGGVLFPKDTHIDGSVDFTDPTVPDIIDSRVADVEYKTGYDVDAIAGYDFGMFRLEGELGYKRVKNDVLDFRQDFVDDLNTGSGGAFVDTDFDLDGHTSVLSGMVNGLVDFGPDGGLNGFVGVGAGRAKVKQFGDSDSAWAYQALAGVRMPVSSSVDVGLKYRYFRTGKLNYGDDYTFLGVAPGSGGTVFLDNNSKFSSHSLLASLIFNLGGTAAPAYVEPAPVAAPPPPPPVAEPAPLPPPPPPPPPAPVERGERGR